MQLSESVVCLHLGVGTCAWVCVHTEIHKKSRSSERWHTRRASSHQSEKQVFSNQPSFLAYFLCRLTAQTSFTCRPPALSPDPILLKVTPSDNLQVLFSVFATFGLFFFPTISFSFYTGCQGHTFRFICSFCFSIGSHSALPKMAAFLLDLCRL